MTLDVTLTFQFHELSALDRFEMYFDLLSLYHVENYSI